MRVISRVKMLVIIIMMSIGLAAVYSYMRCQKAILIAEDYLSGKYEKKMENTGIRYSWIDPCLYHVYFSPEENPELTFRVLVQNDLSVSSVTSEFGKETESADDYYIKYFEHELEKSLQKEMGVLLGGGANITVLHSYSGMYSFSIPDGLSDNVALKDMLEIIDGHYYVYVEFSKENIFDIDSKELSRKCFAFLQTMKSKYDPLDVIFQFWLNGEKKRVSIGFDNWKEIDTIDEFANNLKKEVRDWRQVR